MAGTDIVIPVFFIIVPILFAPHFPSGFMFSFSAFSAFFSPSVISITFLVIYIFLIVLIQEFLCGRSTNS